MNHKFTTIITREVKFYVARCAELGVVSQGKTIKEAQKNLKEAVELYLENLPLKDLPKKSAFISTFKVTHA